MLTLKKISLRRKVRTLSRRNYVTLLFSIFVGGAYFLYICGIRPLDIGSIEWLSNQDQYQIYLSWIFFKNSLWNFPVGLNPDYGLNIPSAIAYNASGIAILLKLFLGWTTQDYQYLGWWYLLCFILQVFFSIKLIGLVTDSQAIKYLSAGFFVLSTPMLSRINLHALLVPHFLILAAFYLSFSKVENRERFFGWLSILVISAILHFYIFFIIGVLWLADGLNRIFISRTIPIKHYLLEVILIVFSVIVAAWQAGYFAMQGMPGGEFGYGLYRTHLLSLFDGANWSLLLKNIPTSDLPFGDFKLSDGTYEGQLYLGLGGILIFLVGGAALLTCAKQAITIIKKYSYTLLAIFGLAFLSLSNNITFLKWNLHIPLPADLLNIGSILRASGRLAWPFFYAIIFMSLAGLIKIYKKPLVILILLFSLLLQFIDLSVGIAKIRETINSNNFQNFIKPFDSELWDLFPHKYNSIAIIPLSRSSIQANWLPLSFYASRKRMGTNAIYQGRVDLIKVDQANSMYDKMIDVGSYATNSVYIVDDDLVMPVLKTLNRKQDLFARLDGFNVLAPGWLTCNTCPQVSSDLLIKAPELPLPKLNTSITFGSGGSGAPYLLGIGQFERVGWGWAYPESWGVWSEGRQAKLIIPYPKDIKPTSVTFLAKALIAPNHPTQRVEILVNNQLQKSVILDKFDGNLIEVNLPKDTVRDFVLIDFHFPNAISAKELGMGEDMRKLAIGLERGDLR